MPNPIKTMIQALHQGKTSEAFTSFEKAMSSKVNAALDERKIAIASQVYPVVKKQETK
jgi:hypothetical protein